MALFTEQVPENDGKALGDKIIKAKSRNAFHDLWVVTTGLGHSRKVPFDISHKDRHTNATKVLSKNTQGDGFPGSSGSGNESMTIRHARQEA
jgi:hypothetical protein